MRIMARVHIETAKRAYKPGEDITGELSKDDMAYLAGRGFITMEDDGGMAGFPAEGNQGSNLEDGTGGSAWQEEDTGLGGTAWIGEAALKKMSKDEIVEYASGIGLELDSSSLKQDLVDAVLNCQEEQAAGKADI